MPDRKLVWPDENSRPKGVSKRLRRQEDNIVARRAHSSSVFGLAASTCQLGSGAARLYSRTCSSLGREASQQTGSSANGGRLPDIPVQPFAHNGRSGGEPGVSHAALPSGPPPSRAAATECTHCQPCRNAGLRCPRLLPRLRDDSAPSLSTTQHALRVKVRAQHFGHLQRARSGRHPIPSYHTPRICSGPPRTPPPPCPLFQDTGAIVQMSFPDSQRRSQVAPDKWRVQLLPIQVRSVQTFSKSLPSQRSKPRLSSSAR